MAFLRPYTVIAMINGLCYGAASDVALACDFRYAADEASLGEIRIRRALNSGAGGTWFLPRLVGLSRALRILYTGKTFDGKEAERIGMVNWAVPLPQLREVTMQFAHELAAGPTKVIGHTKRQVYYDLMHHLDDGLNHAALLLAIDPAEDFAEGKASFLEKRAPCFTGR